MSLTTLTRDNGGIHALSIIPDTHSELFMVIADFNLDLPCPGVSERVLQRLSGNPVDLVTQDGMQIARLAFNGDPKGRRPIVGGVRREFLSQGIHSPCEIVALDRGLT